MAYGNKRCEFGGVGASNNKYRKDREAVLTGVYSAVLGQSFWGKLTRFIGCVN